MAGLISFVVIGLFTGAAYAIAASGLVLTYSTTRVFNVAHGAFGMLFAFVFWDLSQRQGIATVVSLLLVLFVIAPLFGYLVQRFIARGLGEAPIGVSLVVTVGLLVGLIGVATQVWPPMARTQPLFFGGSTLTVGTLSITWHQVFTIFLSVVVAVALYLLLNRTRTGRAMRASVDNPGLLRLYGGRPELVAALSWAIGTALAALAGIMLAPVVGLQYYDLTLLVISAFAAALIGKLKSLPMTFAGAMGLGVLQSLAIGYLPSSGTIASVRAVVPTLFLFVVIVALPQAPLRIGQVKGMTTPAVPALGTAAGWGAALFLLISMVAISSSEATLLLVGVAVVYAVVMLSLVLLAGYGGHVSLAQFTFAGVGAVAYSKLGMPSITGMVVAALVAAAVGALVALPVLRLTGLYLALATLAFAQLMDKLVFTSPLAFELGSPLTAERPSVLGVGLGSTSAYVILEAAFLVVLCVGIIAVRRGPLGRILIAMRDSQAACGTLGLDMRWFRVGLFAASAGVAGLGGAMFAALRGTIAPADFGFFASLVLLLIAVIFGVTSVTGAVVGGVFLMYMPEAQTSYPAIAGLVFAIVGFGAVALGRDPNGLASRMFLLGRWVRPRVMPFLESRMPALGVSSEDLRRLRPGGFGGSEDHRRSPEEAPGANTTALVSSASGGQDR